jgi:N-formylglutamate amidohydrolase
VGTSQHRDPGQRRAEIIVSDSKGKSSISSFKDLVISAYEKAGFKVAYNWPYFGGRLTEHYGRPDLNHQVIQVELNRGLYMNESNKQILPEWQKVSSQIGQALSEIKTQLPNL